MIKTLIFDFDGTIADSFSTFVEIYNEIGSEYNLKELTRAEAENLRGLTPKEVVRALNISLFTLPFYILRGRSLFNKKLDKIQPIKDISPVLQELSKKYTLAILTSNSKQTVESFLAKHEIEYFQFIRSEKNIFGKHKALQKVIDFYGLKKDEVMYIGDEVRDIECCKKSGVTVASVTWGLNNKAVLEKYNPDYICTKPEQLLQL